MDLGCVQLSCGRLTDFCWRPVTGTHRLWELTVVWRQDVLFWGWAATVKTCSDRWSKLTEPQFPHLCERDLPHRVCNTGSDLGFWCVTVDSFSVLPLPLAFCSTSGQADRKAWVLGWGSNPVSPAHALLAPPPPAAPCPGTLAGYFPFCLKPLGIYLGAAWSPQRAPLCEQETCSSPAGVCVAFSVLTFKPNFEWLTILSVGDPQQGFGED